MLRRVLLYNPLKDIDLACTPIAMSNHEFTLTAFAAHRVNRLRVKKSTVEAHVLYKGAGLPVPCPMGKLSMKVRSTTNSTTQVPNANQERKIPLQTIINNNLWKSKQTGGALMTIKTPKGLFIICPKSGGGNNIMRPVQPSPVTTVHMQVEPPKKIHVSLPAKQESPKKEEPSELTNGNSDENEP